MILASYFGKSSSDSIILLVLLGPSSQIDDGLLPQSASSLCARPLMARMARFSRLSCPLTVVLLEKWTFCPFSFLFFAFLLTRNYLGTADSVGCVTLFRLPEHTHFQAGQRKRPLRQTNKNKTDVKQ